MVSEQSTLVERFKPTIGRWWGIIGLAMVAFVVVAVVSSGSDAATLAVALGIALLGWATYAALVRPTVHAYEDHLLLRNAVTDLRLPWRQITDVDVRQTLCVYTGIDKHHGIAVGKSARYLMRGEKRAQSLMATPQEEKFASRPTMTGSDVTGMHYADYVTVRIEALARQQTDKGGLERVERHWAWPTVLVGAAMVVVFVVLVVAANL
ncbi:hypothetical protein [Solicola gregarius]|uniref:PH domain-containing protein n=1 Tax=Solicola gregarius TaxID=2908642 RepID=A0AA46TF33_9ACTN|nr:hypothetical protein [Solicola gregarius]UYM03980.1 hypothetical protein L0C25_15675 [Solicola gregarius]